VQLLDAIAPAGDIDNDLVEVQASAWFSPVAGCPQTYDVFGVVATAFDGTPDAFATRWTNGINAAREQGTARTMATGPCARCSVGLPSHPIGLMLKAHVKTKLRRRATPWITHTGRAPGRPSP
jgi:hypothetical protein